MQNVKQNITILGIESSCDETSAAIIKDNKILANIIADQSIHAKYGGVVPELASRAHQKNIIPVVDQTLKESGILKDQLSAVAFTRGPGLLGSLLVGNSFAKTFAQALALPLIEVNHMLAHAISPCIPLSDEHVAPKFPYLCLTVSGGHTQIVKVSDYSKLELLGQTIDDAAGEAFDKIAKIMGLPYPGGPQIDKLAKTGNKYAFEFVHPNVPDYNYSFSGFKTAFLNFVRKEMNRNNKFIQDNLNDLCASVQYHIIQILINKLKLVIADTGIKEIGVAGGVSANSGLRHTMKQLSVELELNIYMPPLEYCTDNAAMIAFAGFHKFLNNEFTDYSVTPLARYAITK